jgi:cytochrome c-type biogenesis protein CcmH/NrfG
MGRILFLRGDSEAAIEKIQATLALDGGYVEAWLHLGLVYLVADDQAAAIEAFEQVIALAPGSNQAVFAEELIRDFGP